MTVNQNSIQHYRELIKSDRLGVQQRKVLQFIMENPGHTRNEISRGLNLPVTTICGRVTELKEMKLIHQGGMKNRRATLYIGRDENETIVPKLQTVLERIIKLLDQFPSLKPLVKKYLS